jgi:exoribonuclease R
VVDWVEACLLERRVGEVFTGTVVEVDHERHRGTVVIQQPAVEARVDGDGLPLGHQLQVRLTQADPEQGRVTFVPA